MKIRSINPNEPDGRKVDIDGVKYHFRPGADGNVCEVGEKAHVKRFLAIPEGYEVADESLTDKVTPTARVLPKRTGSDDPFAAPKTEMVDKEHVPTDEELNNAQGDEGDKDVPVPKKAKAKSKAKAAKKR